MSKAASKSVPKPDAPERPNTASFPEGMSVKELIAALRRCPDRDAWVMIKPESGGDMQRVTGVNTHPATAFLTLGRKGWW